MRKRGQRLITIVIILILGGLIGSGLMEEIFVRLNMAMKFSRTLDYYEYHWRGDKESRLLSLCIYTWQKQGTQRKCLEYIPVSTVEAVIASYTLEGYDSMGNLVYQKKLTTEGKKETHWSYIYDEQGRVVERATWTTGGGSPAKRVPSQLQKHHYYEDGMRIDTVYDYQGGISTGSLSSMTFYDRKGQELLHKTYGSGETVQEVNRTTLSLGAYGREELVCEGDYLIAYRWYEYNKSGGLSYLLEITPEGTDSVDYQCTYTIFDYDARQRLKASYRYEPVMGEHPDYYIHFRFGDVDTGIILNFDEKGRLNGFASAYYMDEDQPGEVLYYIFPQEDGTFELSIR